MRGDLEWGNIPRLVQVAADGRSLRITVPPCAAGPATLTIVTPGGTVAVAVTYVADGRGPGAGSGGRGGSGPGSGSGAGADGRLPRTGADVDAAWWAALALLVGGALVLTARLGRREDDV